VDAIVVVALPSATLTMSADNKKIAFSLSETSFALQPPPSPVKEKVSALPNFLQEGDGAYGKNLMSESQTSNQDSFSDDSVNNETAEERMSQLMLHNERSFALYPPPPHNHGPIIAVTCYSQFSDLAHGPRGTEAKRAMRTYRLNISDGTLTLLSMTPEGMLHNPAFCRWHPKLNVLYSCTESLTQEGKVYAFALNGKTGAMQEHCPAVAAGGFSTCYLTIHPAGRRMLLVNYWDSTICTLSLNPDGAMGSIIAQYDPKQGKKMKASSTKHVNHSRNDAAAQKERQGDPHSHAIVLEPTGTMAYVPDLGMDVIRQFFFDESSGKLTPCGEIVSGVKAENGRGLGPRYLQFHPSLPTCYVVNELSSQVAVFEYNQNTTERLSRAVEEAGSPEAKAAIIGACEPTLSLIQTASTLPEAFPPEMNTCGRITIHPSGDFVVTSNRGHDSVAVHRIHRDSTPPGMVTLAGIFHTRGETPRHFQFDKSGQWLLVANQDSNTCAVFQFNNSTGEVSYTGNTYGCQSPNFVCVWGGA